LTESEVPASSNSSRRGCCLGATVGAGLIACAWTTAIVGFALNAGGVRDKLVSARVTMAELNRLQRALAVEYDDPAIYVSWNNSYDSDVLVVAVDVDHFPANDLDEQARMAREIAFFARDHFALIDRVDGIAIMFTGQLGSLRLRRGYSFSREELGLPNAPGRV
jgi:hypothetical protein